MKRKLQVFLTESSQVIKPPRAKPENDGGMQPDQVAVWVKPPHKVFFLLAISLYQTYPRRTVGGYTLVPELSRLRLGVWRNSNNHYFIGCKGTSVVGPTAFQDISDDAAIAGLTSIGKNDISLVQDTDRILHKLVRAGISTANIAIGGHSLGGYAALVISMRYQLQCCVFNAAAPPTNPVLIGPGPLLATHYHIVGDIISSHMLGSVAEIIRVDKNHNYFFSPIWAHSTDRFFEKDETLGFMNSDQEDVLFMAIGGLGRYLQVIPGVPAVSFIGFVAALASAKPVPGSQRSFSSGVVEQVFKSGTKVFKMAQNGREAINLVDIEVENLANYFNDLRSIALLTPTEAGFYEAETARRARDGVLEIRRYTSYAKSVSTEAGPLIEDLCKKLVAQNIQPMNLIRIQNAGKNAEEYVKEIYNLTKATFGFNPENVNVGVAKAISQVSTPTINALNKIQEINTAISPQLSRLKGTVPLMIVSAIDQELFSERSDENAIRQRAEQLFFKFRMMNIKVEKILSNTISLGADLTGNAVFYERVVSEIAAAKLEVSSAFLRAAEVTYGTTTTAAEKLIARSLATNVGQVVVDGVATISESAAIISRGVGKVALKAAGELGETALVKAGAKVASKAAKFGARVAASAVVAGTSFAATPLAGAIVTTGEALFNLYFLIDLGVSVAELAWALAPKRH